MAERICPNCGFRESDFTKTLRLGCSKCYHVYGAELETFLPKLQTGATHCGKRPAVSRPLQPSLLQELREVESRLGSSNLDSSEADALLDRWKVLSAVSFENKDAL